jgi:hypothetical protein
MALREKVTGAVLVERTVARVVFENGHVTEYESKWGDSQNGRGYDGGHWGPFPAFRDRVEIVVKEAQAVWGLPAAEITYLRESRTTETVLRTYETSALYSVRTIKKAKP